MITSPKQYNPDSEQAKLERGIERLKVTRNAVAMLVCHHVACGDTSINEYKRYARIALAAQNAHTRMLLKYIERR